MRTNTITSLIFLLLISAHSVIQAEELLEPSHVLLLNSYNQRMSWVNDIETAVEEILDPDNNNIVLHIANMDSKQFHTSEYFDAYKKYLKEKYKNNKFSLILSSDNNAFDFLRKNREELFPGVPVAFCGVNNFKDDQIIESDKFTGVAEIFSARNTVEMALKLHSDTKQIFVINDYLATGKAWKRDINTALSDIKETINITYAKNLTIDELQATIADLDKNTIVLLGVYFADKNGKYFTYEKVGAMISGASQVPVYCLLEFNMGSGVVGGEVISGYYQGQAMAKIGKRILDGEDPDDIPVIKKGTNRVMFDYVQLKRFGITESSLPQRSIIINKPFSIFQRYKKELFTIVILILLLIITIIALTLSIWRRVGVEKDLKQSDKKHRKLVSNISDVIVILNKKGIISYKSPNITEQFGWNPDDLIGKHGLFTVHPDDQKRIEKMLMELCAKNNSKIVVEYNYLCKDGTFKPVELTAVNMTSDSIINGVLANYKDVTHRKLTEKALRISEERLKAIFNASPDPIVVYNNQGHPEYMNSAFTDVFAWLLDELRDQRIPFVPEDQKEKTRLKIKEIYQSGIPVRFETKRLSKHGEVKDILLSAAIIKNYHGINDGLVVNLKDITERKKFELQVRQAQKMESIGTLAGGIAHDFNNILFPVLGHTEMLLNDIPDDNPAHRSLEKIYAAANRAKELVKQILTFSRQESNEQKLMKVQPIIKEALKLIRATIPTTIDIKDDIRPDCNAIKADPTQIHQIVMNLATNAYHAMEKSGGELKVSLKEIYLDEYNETDHDMAFGNYVCLSIADTGEGIDNELKTKIFDPFFTTKEIGKGTGMGLSVVHGIVKSMKGSIQIQSSHGKGARFNVYFPTEESFSELQNHKQNNESLKLGTEHILLIDDEEAILTMEKQILERLGYQVTLRSSSIEALEAFRNSPDKFDLIITDMAMPNMPGDRLSVELTKIRPGIPILLCTGFSEIISEEKAESLGINGFLLKPIVMKDLAQKIRDVLDENNEVLT